MKMASSKRRLSAGSYKFIMKNFLSLVKTNFFSLENCAQNYPECIGWPGSDQILSGKLPCRTPTDSLARLMKDMEGDKNCLLYTSPSPRD